MIFPFVFPPFFAPIFFLPFIIVGAFLAAIVAGFAVIGGPDPCTPGGAAIVISEQHADAFERKWEEFDATLDAGSPATVTFTESEVSSRAIREAEGIDDEDFLQDFRICIHDGYGEMSGTLNFPGFLDTKFRARGTAYIDKTLNVDIDDVDLGSIPGFLDDWIRGIPDNTAEVLDEDDFGHTYELTLREGEAHIAGTP